MGINQPEREFLSHLYRLYVSGVSSVMGLTVASHNRFIFKRDDLPGDVEIGTARSLHRSGYISMDSTRGPERPPTRGRPSYYLSISPAGRQLVERDFHELPVATPGSQFIQIVDSTVGNAAFSQSGDVSISESPVDQRSVQVDQLLTHLMDTINASDLPSEIKREAIAESGQLALEVRKPRPASERIKESLDRIAGFAAPANGVVDLLNSLKELLPI